MCSGSEAGSYLMLIDSCITQLKAQGPSRPCHESKEEEEEEDYHPQLSSPDGAWASCTNARSVLLLTALEVTQGQILSQSPTDATRFWWELTKETIDLHLGCIQGGAQ